MNENFSPFPNIMNILHFRRQCFVLSLVLFLPQSLIGQGRSTDDSVTLEQRIQSEMAFPRRIVWVGEEPPSQAQSEALWQALVTMRTEGVQPGIAALEAFTSLYPESPWTPPLHANLGAHYERLGRLSLALPHWEASWTGAKTDSSPNGKRVADLALAKWGALLGRLGRNQQLDSLADEARGRRFVSGAAQAKFATTVSAPARIPSDAYRCGTLALYEVLRTVRPDEPNLTAILDLPAPDDGFSLADLTAIAADLNLGMSAVARLQGDELVAPSIVHWRLDHYGAIVDKRGDAFKVIDPVFGAARWMDAETINAECSGYFLIRSGQRPPAWRPLNEREQTSIRGRSPSVPLPDDDDDTALGNATSVYGTIVGDPIPISFDQPGADPASGSGFADERDRGCGLAVWHVSEPFINLWVTDVPAFYAQSSGETMKFPLIYKQRIDEILTWYWSPDFGKNWGCPLVSFVEVNTQSSNGTATLHIGGGGERSYEFDGVQTSVRGREGELISQVTPGNWSGGLRLQYPDKSEELYAFAAPLTSGLTGFYLTELKDPMGRITDLSLSLEGSLVKILSVQDFDSKTSTFQYNHSTDPNRVTSISTPYGQANLGYTGDRLTSIMDPYTIKSEFEYNDGSQVDFITDMVTPYGRTTFASMDQSYANDVAQRSILVTHPGQSQERFAYYDLATTLVPDSDYSQVPSISGVTFDTATASKRNSLHWSPLNLDNISNTWPSFSLQDLRKARMKHWLATSSADVVGSVLSMTREPSPDDAGTIVGHRVYYCYPGMASGIEGSSDLPNYIAELLPAPLNQTRYTHFQRNDWGLPTLVRNTATVDGVLSTRDETFTYDQANQGRNLTTYTPPGGGGSWIYTYVDARVDSVTNPEGYTTRYTYDSVNKNLTSIKHETAGLLITNDLYTTGGHTGWVKDRIEKHIATGNVLSSESFTYFNGLVYTHTDPAGVIRTFTLDSLQRITRIDFSSGGYLENQYDSGQMLPGGNGTKLLDLTATRDRNGHWAHFTYDGLRRLKTQIEKIVYNSVTTDQLTQYGYCSSCGLLETITNPKNEVTRFEYDNAGRLKEVTYADGTAEARSVHYDYNLPGQLTFLKDHNNAVLREFRHNNQGLTASVHTEGAGAGFGEVVNYRFDARDRLKTMTPALGATVTLTYDGIDRLRTRNTTGAGIETLNYSALGLTSYVEEIDSTTSRTTSFNIDLANRKVTVTDGRGNTTQSIYNGAGDLVTLTDENNLSTTWQYNYTGRIVSKFNGATKVLETDTNPGGQLTRRWTPQKGSTFFTRDSIGNARSIDYPNQADVTLVYDSLNRLLSAGDSTFGTVSFNYTSFGTLAYEESLPWPSSRVTYSYDSDRRLSGLSLAQPSAGPWTHGYTYDGAGRLQTLSGSSGNFTYGYENPSDWIHSIALANGGSVRRNPDSLGRLQDTLLRDASQVILDRHFYEYRWTGERKLQRRTGQQIDGVAFDNRVDYGYYGDGSLNTAMGSESSGPLRWHERLTYTLDPAGNLTQRQNHTMVQNLSIQASSWNRLSSASHNGSLTVSGMLVGPVSSLTVAGQSATVYGDGTFSATGLSASGSYTATAQGTAGNTSVDVINASIGSPANFVYDSNGNLTGDGRRTFYYDDADQLTKVEVAGDGRVEYVYDGLGRRRIRKDFNTSGQLVSETRYVYDGMRVLQQRNSANQVLVTYTRGVDLSGSMEGAGGIGGLLARTDGSGTAYYHSDGSGNVTALVDGQHQLVARYVYEPFGSLIGAGGSLAEANTMRFSSKEYDPKAGLYYFGFRFYEPNLQRWLNHDPLGEEGGINLYGFVSNDPVNSFDPFGLFPPGGALFSSSGYVKFEKGGATFIRNTPEESKAVIKAQVAACAIQPAVGTAISISQGNPKDILIDFLSNKLRIPLLKKVPVAAKRTPKPRVKKLGPQSDAPHTVFKRGPDGRVSGYTVFNAAGYPVKRFRGTGKPHGGLEPPFILEPRANKGPGSAPVVPRPPTRNELPPGY